MGLIHSQAWTIAWEVLHDISMKQMGVVLLLCWWQPALHFFHSSTYSLEIISNTFSHLFSCMNSNKLLLNLSKIEFLLIGTKQQLLKFPQLTTLSLGNDIIPVSSSARNLGFIFDSHMSFTDQINSLSKSCLLPLSVATTLVSHSSPANWITAIHSTMAFRK